VELPPSSDVLGLTAEEFFAILRDQVRPTSIVEGPDFHFGRGRAGNIRKMLEWSAGTQIRVLELAPQEAVLADLSLVEVSSTLIRWLVGHGRMRDAAICLTRPYALRGPVIRGFARGRTIGVPTANLEVRQQLIPLEGIYAGRCAIDGTVFPAAVSIGAPPTFAERAFQVEAHLLGFSGELYGRTIELEMIDWLREQRAYSTVEALRLQIDRDLARVRQCLAVDPLRREPSARRALAGDSSKAPA
ncbi:MAG: hypothetical protein NZ561_03605, partial [Phycisphaerae bacterium]|nr:hypothetical protein [Phycisphaerae bacterium]